MAKFWREIRGIIDTVAGMKGIPLGSLRKAAQVKDPEKMIDGVLEVVWPMIELRINSFVDELQDKLNNEIDDLQSELTRENIAEMVKAALKK